MNIATFDLPTDVSGSFDYKVEITGVKDTSPHNNSYIFTQTVAGQRSILLVTEKRSDVTALESLYRESAVIDSYVVSDHNGRIPYTIEDLVAYDEIILSNVDIRKIDNIYAFIDSVDLAVSQYGKSLITLGDLAMQNKDDDIFARLEELLPVSFGNANKDARLYTIVLDISRSMYDTSQLATAKDAALKLLSILGDDDHVAYVTLAGEARVEMTPTKLGLVRQELYEKIQSAQPTQGTFIGEALNLAYEHIKDHDFAEKQVMLISDGLTFTFEPEDAADVAKKMRDSGIVLSTVNVIKEEDEGYLKNLANIGGGKYYYIQSQDKVSELVFAEIADDITESVVERKSSVNIVSYHDDTVEGILSLPDIDGYLNSKAKLDATMVLSVDYVRANGTEVEVPLYSYRDHGNGRVATFTSSLSGQWLRNWTKDTKTRLFGNILVTNTPSEYVNYPFNVLVDYNGDSAKIEILPSAVNPKAKATIGLTYPDGTRVEREMTFMLNRYTAELDTPDMGKYSVDITYTYGNHSFTSSTFFTAAYSREYDSFAAYDIVNIYDFMRGVGQISEDGNLDLSNEKGSVDTYELSFRIPLLILAAVLFVADVVVRKFKWKDIKGLFAKKKKEGENVKA
jgi:Mg-chelatase subunit ChlD